MAFCQGQAGGLGVTCDESEEICLPCLSATSNTRNQIKGRHPVLWTIFVILLILWLLGFGFHIAGSLIHLLLVVAVVILVINLVSGRRTV
jgi:hypothetical protein